MLPDPKASGHHRLFRIIALALLVLLPVVLAAMLWRSLPPRSVTMVTGAAGGAYHQLGGGS